MALENWNTETVVKPLEPMRFSLLDDTRSLQSKIEEKAYDLFKARSEETPLQITRVFKEGNLKSEDKKVTRFKVKQNINDASGGDAWNKDCLQIFTVRQDRSWTTLNISRSTFEGFMNLHNIMPSFWKHVFTFGRKTEENEFLFPGFNHRRSGRNLHEYVYEFAYIVRRVEPNGRDVTRGEWPWSIRQTAVYHKFSPVPPQVESGRNISPKVAEENMPKPSKSMFLLIAPSTNVESMFSNCLDQSHSDEVSLLSAWNVHRILIADSLQGWMDYMASLEKRLKEQSDRIILASVGCSKEKLSPLLDFNINFEDRQELKVVEDKVLDLQVILPGLLRSISAIQQACKKHGVESYMSEGQRFVVESLILEFDEYIEEAKLLNDRSKILIDKSCSTAELLSDLLDYEEAVALKELTRETQVEGKAMCGLTERSTKDAASVKILTVITLVYLPTTIVANFFSTQFVQSESNGMKVSKDVWILVAISVPLTFLTILLWWGIVHFTAVARTESKDELGRVTFQRQNSIRSLVPTKKKRDRTNYLEHGGGLSQSPTFQLSSLHDSSVKTWSSLASTV